MSKCTCYAHGQIAFNQKQLTCIQNLLVWMANCVDQDHMVHFRRYVIWIRAVHSRVNMHILCRLSNQCLVESSKLRPNLLVWMADCVDLDQIVHFRSYAIWVRPFCLPVQMDMPRTWSNQRLVESSQTASKTTGWMANSVDPDQIVHVRSYPLCVLTCRTFHVQSALSRKQPNCVQNYWLNGKLCRPRSNSAC